MPTWPVTLPSKPLMSGYSEKFKDQVIRSQMDAGPVKVRRRFTASVIPITLNLVLTGTELGYLETFFYTDIYGGSISFTYTDPRTSVSGSYRFTESPQISQISGDLYSVSMNWEKLP